MKSRNGFVSNSSSSSFMCVVPKETYDKYMETVIGDDLKCLKCIMESDAIEEQSFMGKTVVILTDYNDMGGYGRVCNALEELDKDDLDDPDMDTYESWDKLQSAMQEGPDSIVCDIDM